MRTLIAIPLFMLVSGTAAGADKLLVGDPIHGKKLYRQNCAACHGEKGHGGRTGVALTDSGRMNLIRDDQMFKAIQVGRGIKKTKEHSFKSKMKFLELWDVIAFVRTMHMTIDEFFPNAARYISKSYTIDKHGLERIQETTGKKLKGPDKTAPVFTMFDFDGEDGNLSYVPQDPIKLDQLKKKNKSGYLVFLPFEDGNGFRGEVGVGMDPKGVITKLRVHSSAKGADLLNKSLSRFESMGKKGQTDKFKVGGGASMAKLADRVFPMYLRAMETVTMYDREERERTWADPD